MYLTELILRARRCCPTLARRVGGTASFEKATNPGADFAVPHAFIVPTREVTDEMEGNASSQRITETFVVIVCVSNKVNPDDGAGLTATDTLETIKRELLAAFLGWEPLQWRVGSPQPVGLPTGFEDLMVNSRLDWIRYKGASHVDMNAVHLWHEFEFTCSYMDGPVATSPGVTSVGGNSVAHYFTVFDPNTTPNNESAVVTAVIYNGAQYYDFTFDNTTGLVHTPNLPASSSLTVWYSIDLLNIVVRTVYAEYYPTLLALAGGNPRNITPLMYQKASELGPDDTVGSFYNEEATDTDPQKVFGETYYRKPNGQEPTQ